MKTQTARNGNDNRNYLKIGVIGSYPNVVLKERVQSALKINPLDKILRIGQIESAERVSQNRLNEIYQTSDVVIFLTRDLPRYDGKKTIISLPHPSTIAHELGHFLGLTHPEDCRYECDRHSLGDTCDKNCLYFGHIMGCTGYEENNEKSNLQFLPTDLVKLNKWIN